MTPERARALLHAYLDGELDASSTIELEAELERTPALRRELQRLKALQTVVRDVGYVAAPEGLKERMFASIANATPRSTTRIRESVPSYWRIWAIQSGVWL